MRFVLAPIVAALAAGCGPSAPLLTIDGVFSVDRDCTIRESASLLAEGTLDVGTAVPPSARPAGFAYLLQLSLSNRETHAPVRYARWEDPNVALDHAEVTLRANGEVMDLGDLPNPMNAFVDGWAYYAYDPRTPGAGWAWTEIPDAYGVALANAGVADVELDIRVHGVGDDGNERWSATYAFPVHLCSGCLLSCAATASAPVCAPGQDTPSAVVCP